MQGRHTMRIHVTRKRILGALAAVTLTVVVAATAAALIGGPLHAQRRGFGGPGVRGGTLPLWTVELTDGQQAQVEQIREAAREAAASVRDEMREARQALGEAVRAGVVDESRIRSLAARGASLEADALVRQAHAYADTWEILTPEQQDQVREMRERRSERFAEQRERIRNRRRQ